MFPFQTHVETVVEFIESKRFVIMSNIETDKLMLELEEYKKCSNTPLGRLIANREVSVLKRARTLC